MYIYIYIYLPENLVPPSIHFSTIPFPLLKTPQIRVISPFLDLNPHVMLVSYVL